MREKEEPGEEGAKIKLEIIVHAYMPDARPRSIVFDDYEISCCGYIHRATLYRYIYITHLYIRIHNTQLRKKREFSHWKFRKKISIKEYIPIRDSLSPHTAEPLARRLTSCCALGGSSCGLVNFEARRRGACCPPESLMPPLCCCCCCYVARDTATAATLLPPQERESERERTGAKTPSVCLARATA